MKTRLLVSVVDDDESVRESLPDLVREMGFEARSFESAEAFLTSGWSEQTSCLILDVMMPGMSGLELAAELKARGMRIPIIFITANHNGIARAQLQESGAVTCLYKPFSDVDLSEALFRAVQQN
jgi:FixJ family two-component response regulator